VNLTSEDFRGFVRGADKQYQLPHSGYDESLKMGKVRGVDSPIPIPNDIEFDGIFEELALDFPQIQDLYPDEIPLMFTFAPLHHSAEWISGTDPDPELVEGFWGQILKADNSAKESPPCPPWLGPAPLVPAPTPGTLSTVRSGPNRTYRSWVRS